MRFHSAGTLNHLLVQHSVPVVDVPSLLPHLPLPLVLLMTNAIQDIGSGAQFLVVSGGHWWRRLVLVGKGVDKFDISLR